MRTFKLNSNYDWEVPTIIKGIDAIEQNLRTYCSTLKGEMIHKKQHGIPFFDEAFNYYPNIIQLEVSLRRRMMEVKGVEAVGNIDINIEGDVVKYRADVQTIYGDLIING